MDEIVRQALAKWPNVPDCYGWLALDARGAFRMRDTAAQAANAPGDVIRHPALLSFIYRNYLRNDDGAWFFQNGPWRGCHLAQRCWRAIYDRNTSTS